MLVILALNHTINTNFNSTLHNVYSWDTTNLTWVINALTLMAEFSSQDMVFNENHFPFHDGFLDTRNSLKILTRTIPIFLPSCLAGTTTSHIVDLTHKEVNHQEGDLVSNEEQPTLGDLVNDDKLTLNDISIHAGEATSHENDTSKENNQQTQQDNTHWMQTKSKIGIYKPKLPYI